VWDLKIRFINMNEVYITAIEKYMPNQAVSNEEMEDYLGLINGNESKSRGLILRNNKIRNRYYALDKNGNPTHSNAELTAAAIKKVLKNNIDISDIELLTAGTSSPDAIQPSHALMVHGELGTPGQMEVMSAHGTCNAGMLSLKYAFLALASGEYKTAVSAASEIFSSWMLARNYDNEIDKRKEIESNPYIAFEKDFLRWMLSDGASAALLQTSPNSSKLSLKIEWIDIRSYANSLETCMFAGCVKNKDGSVKGWRDLSADEQNLQSVFSLKQDARLLQKHIIDCGVDHLGKVCKKRQFDTADVDWFLPHLSSMFFKDEAYNKLIDVGFGIPMDKWFMNLPEVGNVGAASAFLMIEELFNSNKLKPAQKILVMVPESARFSSTYMLLTVV
jgi:3-oxoacyl-[acyl-carrier-protein] synthase-3